MFFLFLGPKCLSDHLNQFESVCKKSAKSKEESILGLNTEGKEAARYKKKMHKPLMKNEVYKLSALIIMKFPAQEGY